MLYDGIMNARIKTVLLRNAANSKDADFPHSFPDAAAVTDNAVRLLILIQYAALTFFA